MVAGSRFHDLIVSFSPIAINYDEAIFNIKIRFRRDNCLVEAYITQLLRLVLRNAVSSKEYTSLQQVYDKIESYLRALVTLGVTTDKCAVMFYFLVESSVTEKLLHITSNVPKIRLVKLIKFTLFGEEGEKRIYLAMSDLDLIAKRCKKKDFEFNLQKMTWARQLPQV